MIGFRFNHQGAVNDVVFSPDGNSLLTTSDDRTAKLWNLTRSAESPIELSGHRDWVLRGKFSPNGKYIITTSQDGSIKLWGRGDTGKLENLITFEGHLGQINYAYFSEDGRRIVTSGQDGTARIWNLEEALLRREEHKENIVYTNAIILSHKKKFYC